MDMCNGPIFGKILLFSLPLMLSGILQLLFNAADIIVVGRFAGSTALAAVGSTGALVNLFVNVFIGLSVGANVLVAQYFGAKDAKNVHETVHTSILVAVVGGLILIVLGLLFATPMLRLMDTPEEVLVQASLYLKIYFLGMPAMLVYNFGASILRAIGDTQRPLYYLTVAGVLNVILNLLLVVGFDLGVAGVAIATVVSQVVSCFLIMRCLVRTDGMYRLNLKELHINQHKLMQLARIGIPAGLQGSVFSISNILIQSSINGFGAIAMAGSTAAGNLEGFVYTAMNSIHQTALSFTSQNIGGGRQDRILKIVVQCLVIVTVIGAVLGNLVYFFGEPLISLYSSDPEVIPYGMKRLVIICTLYFLCGMMDVMVGIMRGLGYSMMPTIVSLCGACGLRVLWIATVFQWEHTLTCLFWSYPFTWTVTFLAHLGCFLFVWKRKKGAWAQIGKRGA